MKRTQSCQLFIIGMFLILQWVNMSCGVRKKFVASWDLGNKNNWRDGVTPCPGRKATLTDISNLQVMLDKDMAVESLMFHRDTELIFGKSSSLVFSSERDGSCGASEADSVFENTATGHWWDPDSWQCDGNNVLGCNSAVPDLHKVPCTQDSVFIPNVTDSLYRILFSNPTPTVTILLMGTKNMTTSDFYDFFTSEEGSQRIKRDVSTGADVTRSPLYIESEGPCVDITGCQCHTSSPLTEICRHKSAKCPKPNCSNPIKIDGFCCLMCGADISLSHNGTLAISTVQSVLQKVLKTEGKNAEGYVAKMPDGFIHVYFMPKAESTSIQEAVHEFTWRFEREQNTLHEHILSSVSAEGIFAVRSSNGEATKVIVILLCITLIIGGLIYIYRKRRIQDLPFMFRRMSSGGRRISMRSRNASIPSSVHIVAVQTTEGRSFINPTFMMEGELPYSPIDRSTSQATLQSTLSDISEAPTPQHERENPLYAIQKDTSISFNTLKMASKDIGDSTDTSTFSESLTENQDTGTTASFPQEESIEVNEEIIIDVISDDVLPSEDDDDNDPLEALARSRLTNIPQTTSSEKENDNENDTREFDVEEQKTEEEFKVSEGLFPSIIEETPEDDIFGQTDRTSDIISGAEIQ